MDELTVEFGKIYETCCTTSPGTRSATGTWSWPRCRWPVVTRKRPSPPGRCSGSCSISCSACCIRVMPFVTDELSDRPDRCDWVVGGAVGGVLLRGSGRRGRDLLDDAAGDRGPAVPLGSGAFGPGRVAARLAGIEATPATSRARSDPGPAPGSLRPGDSFAASASLDAEHPVELDVAGAVDIAAERRRLEKDQAAARSEAEQAERKLGNADFTAKAPAAVVDDPRQRLDAARSDIARLKQRLAAIVG